MRLSNSDLQFFLVFIFFTSINCTTEMDTPRPVANPEVDPDFSGPIINVTVALGREAILVCPVTELGHYKVGWMNAEDQTILSLHTRVVTHNARVSVSHDSQRTWNLHIRQVKETDRGCYMCQINTNVMRKQLGCIDVHVPPDIIDDGTSSDVTVQEGDNATLICRARGHPMPRIIWRREDGEHLVMKKTAREVIKVDTYNGDTLNLTKMDRRQMGAYLCIASNDVPPAVSKRITLNVNFAPDVKVPNQLLGAPLGTDVQFECYIEAFPTTINYWVKNLGQMILPGLKYKIEEIRKSYKVHMILQIKSFNSSDLGTYMCVSTNSLGHAEGTVRLYEIKLPTAPPTATIESTTVTSTTLVTSNPVVTARKVTIVTTTTDPLFVTVGNTVSDQIVSKNELSGSSSRHRSHNGNANLKNPYWLILILVLKTIIR